MSPFSANFLPPWSSEQTNGDLTTLAFAALDQKVNEYGFLSLDGSWRSSVNGSRLQIVPDGSAGDPAVSEGRMRCLLRASDQPDRAHTS